MAPVMCNKIWKDAPDESVASGDMPELEDWLRDLGGSPWPAGWSPTTQSAESMGGIGWPLVYAFIQFCWKVMGAFTHLYPDVLLDTCS